MIALDPIAILMPLAAVAIATGCGWIAAAGAWLWVGRWPAAAASASILAQIRLLPLVAVVLLVPAQIAAFIRFEAEVAESAGPLLVITAVAGAALLVDAVLAAWRARSVTRDVVGSWRDSAAPMSLPNWRHRAWRIDRQFPVVAVVGTVRPQLFMADRVAAECTPAELAAIVAHEAAHVRAGDNLTRAAFSLTPGSRLMSSLARAIERHWSVAAERNADERARVATSGLDLASALTKVARMAVGPAREPLVGSALIGELALDARVRLLLDEPAAVRPIPVAWLSLAAFVAVVATLQLPGTLYGLHELFELLVRR